MITDKVFSQSLVGGRGGLTLKQGDEVIDQVVWGTGPAGLVEGAAAPMFDLGKSIVRLPGNGQGNGIDTDNNSRDFTITDQLLPQNSGSPSQPVSSEELSLEIEIPSEVLPGSEFSYSIQVKTYLKVP